MSILSLMAPFSQQHALTSCLCVTFPWCSQYWKLFCYYYICHGDLWPVIFDVAIVIDLGHRRPRKCQRANMVSEYCVCSDRSTHCRSPSSLPLLRPPCSVRHNNIEIRPINLTVASQHSSERKSSLMGQTLLLSYFKKLPSHPTLWPHSDQSATINTEVKPPRERLLVTEGSDMASNF